MARQVIFLVLCTLCLSLAQHITNDSECGPCDLGSCYPPEGCLAGLVKDYCNCCYECGRKEGERCDHSDVEGTSLGRCGDNLECRLRTDLDNNDPQEATCFCLNSNYICGSDGVTYDNICQLTEARYRRRDGLRAVSREPCRSAPRIILSPEDITNVTGSRVALTCESVGWPVPTIAWKSQDAYGNVSLFPGVDTTVVVQSRSGPRIMEITSWLLFTNLAPRHEAFYICSSENDEGREESTAAHVYVI